MKKLFCCVLAVVALLWAPRAAADPVPDVPTQLLSAARVETEGGTVVELPPKWWLVSPDDWRRIDTDLAKLQDEVTRLDAENKSLRQSAEDGPGWKLIVSVAVTAFAAGAALEKWR